MTPRTAAVMMTAAVMNYLREAWEEQLWTVTCTSSTLTLSPIGWGRGRMLLLYVVSHTLQMSCWGWRAGTAILKWQSECFEKVTSLGMEKWNCSTRWDRCVPKLFCARASSSERFFGAYRAPWQNWSEDQCWLVQKGVGGSNQVSQASSRGDSSRWNRSKPTWKGGEFHWLLRPHASCFMVEVCFDSSLRPHPVPGGCHPQRWMRPCCGYQEISLADWSFTAGGSWCEMQRRSATRTCRNFDTVPGR